MALSALFADEPRRRALSERGIAQARRFSWHAMGAQVLDVIERVARTSMSDYL